jgi:polyphosphate glucokinase
MVERVVHVTGDWAFDAVSIGIPAVVHAGHVVSEPVNLAPGWVGFDFQGAFGRPTKVLNDAAMQALGSYEGGKMLFLGLGTGLGSTLVVGGIVVPMELGHLPFRKATFEDYVGEHGRKRLGKRKWQKAAGEAIERLAAALEPDYIVLGGGNAKRLSSLPPNVRLGGQRQRLRRRVPPLASVDPRLAARVRTGAEQGSLPLRAFA